MLCYTIDQPTLLDSVCRIPLYDRKFKKVKCHGCASIMYVYSVVYTTLWLTLNCLKIDKIFKIIIELL